MADVEINVEAPEEEIPQEPVLEPAVEAAAAGVAVAEAAVALSEQTAAAAELEAAALEVVGDQEREAWRTNLEQSISSRLTEIETRTMTALEALALRLETLSTPPAPLVVETPEGEQVIVPAQEVANVEEGHQEAARAEPRPRRHRWI